jgi:hypothetical protein
MLMRESGCRFQFAAIDWVKYRARSMHTWRGASIIRFLRRSTRVLHRLSATFSLDNI